MLNKSFKETWGKILCESAYENKIYALIPGAFNPPHAGHYQMIEHLSKICGPTGLATIVISRPSAKKVRTTADGRVITPEQIKKVLEIYCKNLKNTNIIIAEGSPVKYCYDFGANIESGTVIFGTSKKGEDIKRWDRVKQYYEENYPGITVMDPSDTTLEPIANARDFRAAFPDKKKMVQFIPNHLSDEEKNEVLNILLS